MAVFNGLYAQLAATSAVTSLLGSSPPGVAGPPIFIGAAPKLPPGAGFIVIHLFDVSPESTLQGSSALRNAEIQFDSYGPDQITARALSQAVRSTFEGFGGTLVDGTNIQFVDTLFDSDDPYELGGSGYIFRCVLRLRAFYTEMGVPGPAPGGSVTYYPLTPNNTTTVTAPVSVSSNAILVRNGSVLMQGAGDDYTVSGTIITFAVAPKVGDNLALFQ